MRYAFEGFVLDTDRRELRRETSLVAVEPQVFDLLVYLVRSRERVITKDDLIETVWHGRIVSESALGARISAARAAIGDSGEAQRLIRTFPRKGLRFVGTVHEERDETAAPGNRPIEGGTHKPVPLPDRPSIAVLPFANMSGSSEDEHIADGLSEDLTTSLSRIRWLFVIARNSAFIFKNRSVHTKQISEELGVRYLLEGSIRRAGQRLRITAQLVDAVTGSHHWAERYDRGLDDIFDIQDEITASVAAAIEPRLLAAEGLRTLARSRADLDAWELVAQAQTHFWRLTHADCRAATNTLDRAVALHPDYAPAQSLLGFCLVFAAHMGWIAGAETMKRAREHAIRAVALDDRDPWGHVALGYVAMMERHSEESIAAFRRAVALNSSSAAAHSYLSHGLGFAGHDREAISHGEKAMRLSPLDPETARFLGGIGVAHYVARRFDEAARYADEALRLRPGFQGALRLRCASLAQAGRLEEARSFLDIALREQPQLSIAWIRESVPYQTPELLELFVEGMRKAGLGDVCDTGQTHESSSR